MYLVAIAWMFVVVLMAITEAVSSVGTVLGALVTLVLYGLLPLSIVLYIMGTPMRRRARQAEEARSAQPDGGSHAAGDAVAPEREEP
jgi:membrane protein implicated in regulation of membrane protease activity